MPNPVCVGLLVAVVTFPLSVWLRRRRRARRSATATRIGATLPPTWRPPGPRPVLDASRPVPRDAWSRYERPAYQRRAHNLSTATPAVRAVSE